MCVLTTSTGILFARETKGKYMAPEHCDAFTVKIGWCAVSEAAEQSEKHAKNGAVRIKAILKKRLNHLRHFSMIARNIHSKDGGTRNAYLRQEDTTQASFESEKYGANRTAFDLAQMLRVCT
jgi:hypothetical protein